MGWLAKLRDRGTKRRAEEARRRAALEQEASAKALEQWESEAAELREMLDVARSFEGLSQTEFDGPVRLKKGERLFMGLSGAALVEPRRGAGHYEAAYSGFSFRVAKGIRYHIGGSRGHYVANPETPTAVDSGIAVVTDQRVMFHGNKLAREWRFSKLLVCTHDANQPWTSFSVSNRQKVSGILYDRESCSTVRFRMELALAHFNGTVAAFVSNLQQQLHEHEQSRPSQLPGPLPLNDSRKLPPPT